MIPVQGNGRVLVLGEGTFAKGLLDGRVQLDSQDLHVRFA